MLNTLVIARNLSKSGIERKKAEAVAEAIVDAVDRHNGNLATKDFVHNEIKVVHERINALETKVDERINALETKMDERTNALETKMDALETKMDSKINALEAKVDAKISASETRIVRWVVGTGIGVIGLQITAIAILIAYMS